MHISELHIQNIKSYKEARFAFSKGINIIIGPNNAGKSTILLPILALQEHLTQISPLVLRFGETQWNAQIKLQDNNGKFLNKEIESVNFSCSGNSLKKETLAAGGRPVPLAMISGNEPKNFIFPFLSRRKNANFSNQVDIATTNKISVNFENLTAKIDRISNPGFPNDQEYIKACEEILGFRITTTRSQGGKTPVLIVNYPDFIPLDAMGEGVVNILGLLVNLVVAKEQLFILEEPENDIHPGALKTLLALIEKKALNNQFIITTHSNVVLRQLGGLPSSAVFNIKFNLEENVPTSQAIKAETSEERMEILESLGYELSDFGMWNAWLFLEESSAEKIIREYLIPWFCNSLSNRIRTYSMRCLSETETKFSYFDKLFVFLHLAPTYKNKVWVIIDGGEEERSTIDRLKAKYVPLEWKEENFMQFTKHDFEEYYPTKFNERVQSVLSETDKEVKRKKKKELLQEVENWINENPKDAATSFEASASEIIEKLKTIESILKQQSPSNQTPSA